ncbi:MAG TPA: amidohydrolase, partial [Dehalococcoidia bacterium]|nr:amidohydrolase [Dehalococcoidia bacterium]
MSDHLADLIVRNANILTVDDQNTVAESLAVKNGRFISVGTNNDMEMLSNHSTKVIDVKGMTIVPGFIDAHIHVLSSGTMHVMAADCDKRTIEEIIKILRTRVKETKSNGWIQGFKFDDT